MTEAGQYTTIAANSTNINEQNDIETIDALDYVRADHPLLPPLRSRSINSVMAVRNSARYHAEFWWDVFRAMQEKVFSTTNVKHYQALRAELKRLRQENEQLNHELRKIRKQNTKNKAIITYLGRATPSAGRIEQELPEIASPGSCPFPLEMQYGRKRKRIVTGSDYSNGDGDNETDAILREEIEQLREDNETKDFRLRRLEATVSRVAGKNYQDAAC